MPQLLAITCQKHGFVWWDDYEVLISNVSFDGKISLTTFCNCFVCGQSTTQLKDYKNGPGSKVYIQGNLENYFIKIIPALANYRSLILQLDMEVSKFCLKFIFT